MAVEKIAAWTPHISSVVPPGCVCVCVCGKLLKNCKNHTPQRPPAAMFCSISVPLTYCLPRLLLASTLSAHLTGPLRPLFANNGWGQRPLDKVTKTLWLVMLCIQVPRGQEESDPLPQLLRACISGGRMVKPHRLRLFAARRVGKVCQGW